MTARLVDRRAARRWLPQDLPWPIGCRVTPGHDVVVLELSAVGMLVETDAPLAPGRELTVHLIRPSRRVVLGGRVVRSFVSNVEGRQGPSYRAAIAFNRWFEPLWELDSLNGDDELAPGVRIGSE